MKANIDVTDRREADAIKAGLNDPMLRAIVVIAGVLAELPSQRARKRVLDWVANKLEEDQEVRRAEAAAELLHEISGPAGTNGP